MKILGVSFDYHDAAAALIVDGEVICAIQEERLSRIKHDPVMPTRAMDACLQHAKMHPRQIDAVVFYENPMVKFDRIARMGFTGGRRGWDFLKKAVAGWSEAGKFAPETRLAQHLDIPVNRVHHWDHHRSHAASAFWCSPFERALVLTIDGVGEYETFTASVFDRTGRIEKLANSEFPQSIGLFYSALTAYLGFEVNEGEYKVMGMAAFGEPRFYDLVEPLMRISNGRIKLDQSYFQFSSPADAPYTPKLIQLLGRPRQPDALFSLDQEGRSAEAAAEDKRFADIAASIQRLTEIRLLELITYWRTHTGIREVAVAGGVGLNSLANGKIQRETDTRLYVHPAAGDAGGALGAAIGYSAEHDKTHPPKTLRSAYLGLSYSMDDIEHAVRHYPAPCIHKHGSEREAISHAAEIIANGNVIGWLQDRFEWGPRALGARSILASPAFPDMKERVNRQIKFREPFRPFAPAVLAERASDYFDLPPGDFDCRPEIFMLSVCPVKNEVHEKLPAIVHMDGTARVQLVHESLNPLFYALLQRVGELTGHPVVLNTSFNLRGEPIVSSPVDALQTFEWSEMNNLVMGRVVIDRPELGLLVRNRVAQ